MATYIDRRRTVATPSRALRRHEVSVTVYEDTRCYGGPEEGGWWFTDTQVADSFIFSSRRKANVFLRTLEAMREHRERVRRDGYDRSNEACLAHAERWGFDPDSVGSLDYPGRVFIVLETPSAWRSEASTGPRPHYE